MTVCVTTHASGAPAITAPALPANIVTPFSVAKRFAGKPDGADLENGDERDETPTPTSVRPAAATLTQVGRQGSTQANLRPRIS